MSRLGFFKRVCLRMLVWALKDTSQSQTHPVNLLLYSRSQDGRGLASFTHSQIEIGACSYGLRRECFFPYNPSDRVVIGKFCSIADGVKFVFGEHQLDKVSTFPFRAVCFGDQPHADALSKGQIVIGNDVWIGANAIILSGVEIGHGAVVAAGAVVSKNIPPYAIVGGVPARVIRYRLEDEQISALLKIQWWHWSLAKIKENLNLFYGDPGTFIQRHLPKA